MSPVRHVPPAVVLALGLACGPAPPPGDHELPGTGRTIRAIVGGKVDNADPAVVALAVPLGDGAYAVFCTGTLIAPQTVLSAAHCVDPSREAWAVFGTSTLAPLRAMKVAEQIPHPGYDPESLEADISLWKLAAPVTGTTPVQPNALPLGPDDVGRLIRHVGFGVIDADTREGGNTKRQVTYELRAVDATSFESGADGRQTCFGDSGGPALAALPGQARETVIGVVSWGDARCLREGHDTRVDVYATSFIEPTMAAWELPQCSSDGRCRPGCTPVDADCACAADGQCSADCPNLSNDPDCPIDCGADGVCAVATCPVPDPDCTAPGEACDADEDCQFRLCLDDPHHPAFYCSKPCSAQADCPAPLVCDASSTCRYPKRPLTAIGEPCDEATVCEGAGICAGARPGELRCALPCSPTGACPDAHQTCFQGAIGGRYCADPRTSDNGGGGSLGGRDVLPHVRVEGRSTSSCSSSGGSPVWALALFIVAVGLLARRHRKAGALAVVTAVSLSGCGPTAPGAEGPTPEQLATLQRPIVGGTVDNGDPEVFELVIVYSNNTGSGCTGTLIGNRTIATAAHCADPAIGNATSSQIWAMNKTQESGNPSDYYEVVDRRIHPGWNPNSGSLANDIALLLLDRAPTAPKKPWNSASISNLAGKTVRAVGYGITSNSSNDSGIKRQVNLVVNQVDSTHIYVGNNVNKGICHGDSGGPSFYTFPDGVERLVAIHSYDANGNCTFGGDIRTDAYASFINQWFIDKEGPQCGNDGACKMGCTPVDADCSCVADGICDTRCPSLLQDPDCPKDCVKNGVCSTEPCPEIDEDCAGIGEPCTSELQCAQRTCISDPQNPTFYCSRPCSTTTDCPGDMECSNGVCIHRQLPPAGYQDPCTPGATFCTGGTVCTGPTSDAMHCEFPCTTAADCPNGTSCEFGQGGIQYCRSNTSNTNNNNSRPKGPVFLQRAKIDHVPVASGCAAAGSGPLAALGLLALVRVRRRRAT